MAIIITKNGKEAQRISKSSFMYEDNLQNFIHENPDTVPLYDIDEDIRLLILAREVATRSGSIDAIGTDEKGEVYIIETKLYKNPDKRLVVAQILDYGASISENPDLQEFFKQAVDDKITSHFKLSFNDKISQFFGLNEDDSKALINRFHQNIFDGKFRFIVLMDGIEQRLKDLISFLNRNSSFDIYGVELEFYKYENYEITIPKLFGAEVKKDINLLSVSNNRRKWDYETFFNELHNTLKEKEENQVKELYSFFNDHANTISWGSGIRRGSFNPVFNKISQKSLLSVYTDGTIQLNYAWLGQTDEQIQFRLKYRDLLSKIFTIPPDDGTFKYPTYPIKIWGQSITELKDLFINLIND
jgi:hypothetical protein